MKYPRLYITILSLFLFACGDQEDALTPSNKDRNWLVVEDNPNDAVDHQRFLLFEKWGIPVFYNDTLGAREESAIAEGYSPYETLKVFYSAEGASVGKGHFSLCPPENKSDLLPVLEMLNNVVLPRVTPEMRITSILLVDTLLITTTGIGKGTPKLQHKGFNTWVLGGMAQFHEMSLEKQEQLGIDLLIDLVKEKIDFTKFKAVSNQFGAKYSETSTDSRFYSMENTTPLSPMDLGFPFIVNVAEIFAGLRLEITVDYVPQKITDLDYLNIPESLCLETYGALTPLIGKGVPLPQPGEPKYLTFIPTEKQDINDYCQALFAYTPTEFKAKYAAYPLVLEKYEIVKKAFESFGFKFE